MKRIRDNVARLDVHRDTVEASTRIVQPDRPLDAASGELNAENGRRLAPFVAAVTVLSSITGVSGSTAEVTVAEKGVDMSRFPTPGNLCAWAGVAPAGHESAGKHRPAGTRKGAPWLRRAMIEAAKAAARTNGSHFFARRNDPACEAKRLQHRIEALGFEVTLTEKAAKFQLFSQMHPHPQDRRPARPRSTPNLGITSERPAWSLRPAPALPPDLGITSHALPGRFAPPQHPGSNRLLPAPRLLGVPPGSPLVLWFRRGLLGVPAGPPRDSQAAMPSAERARVAIPSRAMTS